MISSHLGLRDAPKEQRDVTNIFTSIVRAPLVHQVREEMGTMRKVGINFQLKISKLIDKINVIKFKSPVEPSIGFSQIKYIGKSTRRFQTVFLSSHEYKDESLNKNRLVVIGCTIHTPLNSLYNSCPTELV